MGRLVFRCLWVRSNCLHFSRSESIRRLIELRISSAVAAQNSMSFGVFIIFLVDQHLTHDYNIVVVPSRDFGNKSEPRASSTDRRAGRWPGPHLSSTISLDKRANGFGTLKYNNDVNDAILMPTVIFPWTEPTNVGD